MWVSARCAHRTPQFDTYSFDRFYVIVFFFHSTIHSCPTNGTHSIQNVCLIEYMLFARLFGCQHTQCVVHTNALCIRVKFLETISDLSIRFFSIFFRSSSFCELRLCILNFEFLLFCISFFCPLIDVFSLSLNVCVVSRRSTQFFFVFSAVIMFDGYSVLSTFLFYAYNDINFPDHKIRDSVSDIYTDVYTTFSTYFIFFVYKAQHSAILFFRDILWRIVFFVYAPTDYKKRNFHIIFLLYCLLTREGERKSSFFP